MTRFAALLLGLAILPTSASADEPRGEMNYHSTGLRHEKTGVLFPDRLKGLRRTFTESAPPGDAAVYSRSSSVRRGDLSVGIAVAPSSDAMNWEKLRQIALSDMSRIALPEVIHESSFSWPDHPEAVTYYGEFVVGTRRKTYWHAYDGGWTVQVTLTTSRDREAQMQELANRVAAQVLGGAVVTPVLPSGA